MAGPGRPASPRAPVAAETDRPDPPRDGPPRWAGRGSSLPGAPGLGLGGPDSSWAALRSVCFALGPAPEVGTGPDCGLEVAGGRTWVRALGCFLNEVLSASHSGGGDPPAGVVRVDGERRARVRCPPPPPPTPPRGVRWPRRLPAHMLLLFQSLDGFGDGDGPDPASAGGRGGRARPFSVPSWVSVVGRDFVSPLPNSLNPGQEVGTGSGRPGCPI